MAAGSGTGFGGLGRQRVDPGQLQSEPRVGGPSLGQGAAGSGPRDNGGGIIRFLIQTDSQLNSAFWRLAPNSSLAPADAAHLSLPARRND
ncbi:hypothetical protein AAFF_G00050000 [Aldrovandia affinis]|uniref:Uncharacterized protein n=1 Tax=Aldrovandia affinis TaxID=143900 RepID=A0AAD7S1E4_9TELE|nr:hypothetical protein AAFF_G00050000 [Aldrovandia affinis]